MSDQKPRTINEQLQLLMAMVLTKRTLTYGCTSSARRMFAYTLHEAFPVALFLTNKLEFAKFQQVKTKGVQKTPFSICCFLPAGKGLCNENENENENENDNFPSR